MQPQTQQQPRNPIALKSRTQSPSVNCGLFFLFRCPNDEVSIDLFVIQAARTWDRTIKTPAGGGRNETRGHSVRGQRNRSPFRQSNNKIGNNGAIHGRLKSTVPTTATSSTTSKSGGLRKSSKVIIVEESINYLCQIIFIWKKTREIILYHFYNFVHFVGLVQTLPLWRMLSSICSTRGGHNGAQPPASTILVEAASVYSYSKPNDAAKRGCCCCYYSPTLDRWLVPTDGTVPKAMFLGMPWH